MGVDLGKRGLRLTIAIDSIKRSYQPPYISFSPITITVMRAETVVRKSLPSSTTIMLSEDR
ncbi:hypothetical protein SERLA73DRAFT_119578 [Serpula lacrymans var. lacrymans S7.3]|uniref:Uncharacterized protein n=1 Tax=Serpula lacrymans var. lacrymans (strain S7.3) TaxID=936435 RepID=F8PL76_SERL3|nr:hypothetical protein SERLA73DRAFT_119578 [Serpula lacrymans var. lacrymans S7.3]